MEARRVGEFYDDAGMIWSLRSVGPHLHPGSEEATVSLASRAAEYGFAAEGGWVLELGSALGAPSRFLARRFGVRVACVDMDRRMHRAAEATNRSEGLARVVQPILARTERLPLADASCDAAWSQDALCHMEKDAVLAEVARVTRTGAVFAFTDFVARTELSADESDRLRRVWAFPSLYGIPRYVALLHRLDFEVLLAEDRTAATLRGRPRRPDDTEWWEEFGQRFGATAVEARIEAGSTWQGLLEAGGVGYAMFIARKA
ncbi:MAG: methyltransferase domain-containing protein [Tepidiformaceae bacterium]